MFLKGECVVFIAGNYVAWHEVYANVEYVFGYKESVDEGAYDAVLEAKDIKYDYNNGDQNYDPISHVPVEEYDEIIKNFVENYEYQGESSDYAIRDCVVETDDNGNILEVFYN